MNGIHSESLLVNKLMNYMKANPDWIATKIVGGPQQAKGEPDIIAGYRGHYVGIECKFERSSNRFNYSDLQRVKLTRIGHCGIAFGILYREDTDTFLTMVFHKTLPVEGILPLSRLTELAEYFHAIEQMIRASIVLAR